MVTHETGRRGQGLTLKELQEQLGHATMAMTADTYGHLLLAQEETVRDRLASAQARMFPDGLGAAQTRHAGKKLSVING